MPDFKLVATVEEAVEVLNARKWRGGDWRWLRGTHIFSGQRGRLGLPEFLIFCEDAIAVANSLLLADRVAELERCIEMEQESTLMSQENELWLGEKLDALKAAARRVPDPEDGRGFCGVCGLRPPQHERSCWYGGLQVALGESPEPREVDSKSRMKRLAVQKTGKLPGV